MTYLDEIQSVTDTACVICAKRPPADGWTVCQGCAGRLDGDLERIAELVRLCGGWTQARTSHQEPTSRPVAGSRPPLNIGALDAALGLAGGIVDVAVKDREQADDIGGNARPAWLRPAVDTTRDTVAQQTPVILGALESWVKLTREEAGLSPWGVATEGKPVTVAALVGFLRSWLAWIAERPEYPVEELAREVHAMRWDLERLDPDRDKPGLRIPCPSPHPDADGRPCGYQLPLDVDHMADDVPCPRCDTTWSGNRLMVVALEDPAVTIWAYSDVITGTLGIPAATLRQWVKREHVAKKGNRYDAGAAYRRHHKMGTRVAEL